MAPTPSEPEVVTKSASPAEPSPEEKSALKAAVKAEPDPEPVSAAPIERPSRAANDPREVKRRQREAELKSEGVIPAGRQDNTEGSTSN